MTINSFTKFKLLTSSSSNALPKDDERDPIRLTFADQNVREPQRSSSPRTVGQLSDFPAYQYFALAHKAKFRLNIGLNLLQIFINFSLLS
ncbi:hypothetical protein CEXT_406621 [Caerostris extrusa]|uniref:Uncharacterized protein n=1 Tax=Caerostris extrusa TaxID=172846 RepID=A0AAV4S4P7_CAEEX|nr:hypothetical protein CEXT_406621 [Caerostris extrusa]